MNKYRRIEADINLDNIRENIKMMKACVPESMKMLAVIKADAYGHGAVEVSRALSDLADFYAVACIDEAVELRHAGCEKPLLILGYTDPSEYDELITYDVRPAMYDKAECAILSDDAVKKGSKAKIHIKMDTGMSRIGFQCDDAGINDIVEVDHSIAVLKPAMELLAKVVHVKNVKAGTGIGYGWTFVAPHDMRIATVSAGYADGYPRAQSNIGRVIIHGKYAPITGRVCMDQFMIDVSDIPETSVGDTVVLIGKCGDKEITVEEVAEPANSFNYELICNIGRRVPRVYIRDGKEVGEVNYLRRN